MSIRSCLRSLNAMRSVMTGTSTNISRWNTILPGECCNVLCMAQRVACCIAASARSMMCVASSYVSIFCVLMYTRSTSNIVLCILSQIAFDCGFLTAVGTALIACFWRVFWNPDPRNSFPLSYTHRFGFGYLDNQIISNFCPVNSAFGFCPSTRPSSTKLATGSMHVNALNFTEHVQSLDIEASCYRVVQTTGPAVS